MRIGIVILPDQRWSDGARRWRLAEEYGFDHAWTYDHLAWRELADGPWFDAMTTLTAAAGVTRRIGLGTFVVSPAFRHPAHFVREVTGVDDVSGGRLLLGLGAGGSALDAAVLGGGPLTPGQLVDRFGEFVDLLDRLVTGDRVTYSGDWFSAVDARSLPGPVQSPRPPFLIAANGPRAIRLAARRGDGWITTGGQGLDDQEAWWTSVADGKRRFEDALADAGRDPASAGTYLNLDSAPVFSMSSADAFTTAVGRAADLGFSDVVTHWPRASSWYAGDEKTLETVAGLLPKLRAS